MPQSRYVNKTYTPPESSLAPLASSALPSSQGAAGCWRSSILMRQRRTLVSPHDRKPERGRRREGQSLGTGPYVAGGRRGSRRPGAGAAGRPPVYRRVPYGCPFRLRARVPFDSCITPEVTVDEDGRQNQKGYDHRCLHYTRVRPGVSRATPPNYRNGQRAKLGKTAPQKRHRAINAVGVLCRDDSVTVRAAAHGRYLTIAHRAPDRLSRQRRVTTEADCQRLCSNDPFEPGVRRGILNRARLGR